MVTRSAQYVPGLLRWGVLAMCCELTGAGGTIMDETKVLVPILQELQTRGKTVIKEDAKGVL